MSLQREIDEFYNTNEDFKQYVDRVANTYHKTVTATLSLAIVEEVYHYYADSKNKNVSVLP